MEMMEDYTLFCLLACCDPVSFEGAEKKERWRNCMDEKIKAIQKNDTWELINLPECHKPIGVKRVYKTKTNPKGKIGKYKARLMVKGYSQREGVDYEEVFAPVARIDTIRLVIALATQNQWRNHQMDMKSAFFNGYLEEKVYITTTWVCD